MSAIMIRLRRRPQNWKSIKAMLLNPGNESEEKTESPEKVEEKKTEKKDVKEEKKEEKKSTSGKSK